MPSSVTEDSFPPGFIWVAMAHAWIPAVRAAHAVLTQNHIAMFSIQTVNIIKLSVGTNKLIAFNESNNLKELSIYSLPVHRSASSTGSNSVEDMISILQAGTVLEIAFLCS